jgi:hypothetical protein
LSVVTSPDPGRRGRIAAIRESGILDDLAVLQSMHHFVDADHAERLALHLASSVVGEATITETPSDRLEIHSHDGTSCFGRRGP